MTTSEKNDNIIVDLSNVENLDGNKEEPKKKGKNSIVMKIRWMSFILILIIVLLCSIIYCIKEKVNDGSKISVRIESQGSYIFPAITICPYQPFSIRANEYFKTGGMSPKQFSLKLRNSAMKFLDENQPNKAENIIFYDDQRIYYQNLPYNDSIHIGLNQSEIFAFCLTKLKRNIMFGKVDSNCGYTISRYSTPDFFNCYTINVKPVYSKSVEYIQLILRFPQLEVSKQFQEASLLKSLSQNINGAQLVVHESNSSPLSKTEKIHIEPNRLLQINYHNHHWHESSTQLDNCHSDQSVKIIDLDNQYKFTFQECLAYYNSKVILKKCGCMMASLPRPIIPSIDYPYCANFRNLTVKGFQTFMQQSVCVKSVLESLEKLSTSDKGCFKACDRPQFRFRMSSIKWEPSQWKLEWLVKLEESWNTLMNSTNNNMQIEKAKKVAKQFLNASSLNDLQNSDDLIFQKDEQYACVILERISNETIYQYLKSPTAIIASMAFKSIIPHLVILSLLIIEFVKNLIFVLRP